MLRPILRALALCALATGFFTASYVLPLGGLMQFVFGFAAGLCTGTATVYVGRLARGDY